MITNHWALKSTKKNHQVFLATFMWEPASYGNALHLRHSSPRAGGSGLAQFYLFFIYLFVYLFIIQFQQRTSRQLQEMINKIKIRKSQNCCLATRLGPYFVLNSTASCLSSQHSEKIWFLQNRVCNCGVLFIAGHIWLCSFLYWGQWIRIHVTCKYYKWWECLKWP